MPKGRALQVGRARVLGIVLPGAVRGLVRRQRWQWQRGEVRRLAGELVEAGAGRAIRIGGAHRDGGVLPIPGRGAHPGLRQVGHQVRLPGEVQPGGLTVRARLPFARGDFHGRPRVQEVNLILQPAPGILRPAGVAVPAVAGDADGRPMGG